jgi:hypothetical protein
MTPNQAVDQALYKGSRQLAPNPPNHKASKKGNRLPDIMRNLALLALVLFVTLPPGAEAEVVELPPLPERNPLRQTAVVKPVLPGDQPTVAWTEAEIASAAEKCTELLSGDSLDYELLPPIKEGLCGAPSPVLLRAVGHDPKVTIDPPATLSCPMADVLGAWLRDTVQPEAKALFGSPVVKISNASSYVCRNRYGGGSTPLSEHALANAFDVSVFVLANGVRISVLEHWPRVVPPAPVPNPERESVSVSSSASVKQDRNRRPNVVTPARAEQEAPPSPPPPARVSVWSNPFVIEESRNHGPDIVTPARAESEAPPSASPVGEERAPAPSPARVGMGASSNPFVKREGGNHGPEIITPVKAESEAPPTRAPAAEDPAPNAKNRFVTVLHEDACRRFGTVLGPDANDAHKDHFHLDMKKRRRASFCE